MLLILTKVTLVIRNSTFCRLTHHIHIAHSRKDYHCSKCNKAFASENMVQKHMEKVHSGRTFLLDMMLLNCYSIFQTFVRN